MVSSSGTLMSSLESSLTISAVGSSRNSWFWMTSRKCSWRADEGTGTGSRRLSAEGPKTRTKRGQKSAPVERSDAETLFQLFQRQRHLFSPSRVNKTIHSSGYKSIWRLKQEMRSLFKGLTRPENCWSSRQHWVITCFFLTRNRKAIQTNISITPVEHSRLISFANKIDSDVRQNHSTGSIFKDDF